MHSVEHHRVSELILAEPAEGDECEREGVEMDVTEEIECALSRKWREETVQ